MKGKTALVTGGAGYIGSHCVRYLRRAGWDTVTLDDLSLGHAKSVEGTDLVVGDIGDPATLDSIFSTRKIDAVLHFAALSKVGESVEKPGLYYSHNIGKGLVLLDAMARHGVGKLVFSSTCAVYGAPGVAPIPDTCAMHPINPYGYSKMVFERMMFDIGRERGISSIALRYFNAAGADVEGAIGEDHSPETHLIPLAIDAALGLRPALVIYGTDYPTPDGTCIRDYIHVEDLIDAHIRALDYLDGGGAPVSVNLGVGRGHSVREVVDMVSEVTGVKTPVTIGPRRPGDPPELVASAESASRLLGGWKPAHDLKSIVRTAHRWRAANPAGYAGQGG
ncbi:MAG: UDP-glucose 4-epimerase GalE [Nitrospinae bacterium]|nr:UDP-glucose 4-epimerase GalE [Nitrospinota bacterium]